MCNAFFISTPPTFLGVELTWLEYYEIQRYSCTFVKKSVFSGGAAAICLAAAWPADLTGCGNSLTADPGSGRGSQAARADPPRAGQQQSQAVAGTRSALGGPARQCGPAWRPPWRSSCRASLVWPRTAPSACRGRRGTQSTQIYTTVEPWNSAAGAVRVHVSLPLSRGGRQVARQA
jgi:hypothetical protein